MPADRPTGLEDRLAELEIKAALAEDLVDRLNDIVANQQKTIDALVREVARLARERDAGDPAPGRSLFDELPPHY
ncbi:MAG: SlyX family protein [Lautropia sp.]